MRMVTVQARVRTDDLPRFLAASVTNGRTSIGTEAGCRRFDVFQDEASPNLVGFVEIYDDGAAVEAHGESEHFAAWLEAVEGTTEGEMTWATCRSIFGGDEAGPKSTHDVPAQEGDSGGRHIYQGRFRVYPTKIDEFITALTTQASTSLNTEAGCLRFDVGQSVDDPAEVWIYEVYADRAAHLEHRRQPHSVACRTTLDGRYQAPSDSVSGPNVWPPDDWDWRSP